MPRLDAYLYRQFLTSFVAVLLVMLLIVAGLKVIRYLSLAASGEIGVVYLWPIVLARVIEAMNLILPFAMVISTAIVLGRLYQSHEGVVMMAFGLGKGYLLKRLLMVSLPLMLLSGALSLMWVPQVLTAGDLALQQAKSEKGPRLQAGLMQIDGPSMLFIARKEGQRLEQIRMRYQQAGADYWVIAPSGEEWTLDNEQRLVLYDGVRWRVSDTLGIDEQIRFERYELAFQKETVSQGALATKLTQMPLDALLATDDRRAWAEVYWRLGMPMALVMLGLLTVMMVPVNPRMGKMGFVPVALVVFFVYVNLLSLMRDSVNQVEWPVALWMTWMHWVCLWLIAWLWLRQEGGLRVVFAR